MIRVMQFADVINRYDFIDTIVQRANRGRFEVGVCVPPARATSRPRSTPGTPRGGH